MHGGLRKAALKEVEENKYICATEVLTKMVRSREVIMSTARENPFEGYFTIRIQFIYHIKLRTTSLI